MADSMVAFCGHIFCNEFWEEDPTLTSWVGHPGTPGWATRPLVGLRGPAWEPKNQQALFLDSFAGYNPGSMANITDFDPTLKGWLETIWRDRHMILMEGRTKGGDEGMWQIYDRYNVPGDRAVSDPDFLAFIQECRTIAATTGFVVKPQTGKEVPDDFYHFERASHRQKVTAGAVSMNDRIYVHTKDPVTTHALPLAKLLLEMAKDYDGLVKLKVAGPGMPAARKDTIVIWLQHEYAIQFVLKRMKQTDFTSHYGGDTPPGIKVVVPGLGFGKEPPEIDANHPVAQGSGGETNHSYGTYLASGIFLALRSTPHPLTLEKFLDRLLAVFRDIGVDPKKPQEIRNDKRDFKHMNFVTNHTLVLHSREAGDLIVNDHTFNIDPTQPFRRVRQPRASSDEDLGRQVNRLKYL
jgi:hypothetical protein